MNDIERYYSNKTYIELENCLILFSRRVQMIKENEFSVNEQCNGIEAGCDQMRKILDEFKLLIDAGVTKR